MSVKNEFAILQPLCTKQGGGTVSFFCNNPIVSFGSYLAAMAANCLHCGEFCEADVPGQRSGRNSLHFSGRCGVCGSSVHWHQTLIGGAGDEPILGPPRPCQSRCKLHKPDALPPSRL